MNFDIRHINRLHFPNKTLLICEDDVQHQKEFMDLAHSLFERQGMVQVVIAPSAIMAANIIDVFRETMPCVILDHDMPYGNATNLIEWMSKKEFKIPVITASGIPENNNHMERLTKSLSIPCHKYSKFDVIAGKANDLIKEYFNGEKT